VKRVASAVVEQAQSAAVSGYEAVKGLGENIVGRVSGSGPGPGSGSGFGSGSSSGSGSM
jgi:hypothetical protein